MRCGHALGCSHCENRARGARASVEAARRYPGRVLIAVQHLLDRTRHQRQRADDLLELRSRLVRLGKAARPERTLVELARELRRVRERLARAFGDVTSCSGCAQAHPFPYGHWPGGHCCGGDTRNVFTDDEVAALALAGTTPGRLRAPRSDLAGCAFRGPGGCSLEARDRPSLCVRYTCRELETELSEGDDHAAIRALQSELRVLSERFARERERLAAEI